VKQVFVFYGKTVIASEAWRSISDSDRSQTWIALASPHDDEIDFLFNNLPHPELVEGPGGGKR
jgi:hypothetical protein